LTHVNRRPASGFDGALSWVKPQADVPMYRWRRDTMQLGNATMTFKDVLLALTTYPQPTPTTAITEAVACASALGAQLSALACHIEIRAPVSPLGDLLIDVPALVAAEEGKSLDQARSLLAFFREAASHAGVFDQALLERAATSEVPNRMVEHARVRDLTIVPVHEGSYVDPWYAESVIFGSGRPVMIVPERPKRHQTGSFGTIVVAWDFSRPASRAVADALPVLRGAGRVHVVTVENEKPLTRRVGDDRLARTLAKHGIDIVLEQVDAEGRGIGTVLTEYVQAQGADLLVMGAFGHSRVREFILGGATREMLRHPPLPVLMSH
jgi:nucleotide-binding universal stress UspA family protein